MLIYKKCEKCKILQYKNRCFLNDIKEVVLINNTFATAKSFLSLKKEAEFLGLVIRQKDIDSRYVDIVNDNFWDLI
jgi:hypothetical protein